MPRSVSEKLKILYQAWKSCQHKLYSIVLTSCKFECRRARIPMSLILFFKNLCKSMAFLLRMFWLPLSNARVYYVIPICCMQTFLRDKSDWQNKTDSVRESFQLTIHTTYDVTVCDVAEFPALRRLQCFKFGLFSFWRSSLYLAMQKVYTVVISILQILCLHL